MLEELEIEIERNKNLEKAKILQKFFKTGKGEYGEGDKFLGLTSPIIKLISKKYKDLDLNSIQKLLNSKIHDKRCIALSILILLYNKKESDKKSIVEFYLNNTININNWDLVDITCYKILGNYLLNYENKNYDILINLSKSKNMWERRISIVSTMIFVKNNFFKPTLEISKTLLKNEHDLINKAVGWLLREVGKKNIYILEKFLKDNINSISSITLSYAMEKFNKTKKDEIRKLKNKIR